MFNYGVSPFDPNTRCAPTRRAPRARSATSRRARASMTRGSTRTGCSTRAVAHPQDEQWDDDFAVNRANEQDPDARGPDGGLITQSTLAGDESKDRGVLRVGPRPSCSAIPARREHGRHRLCRYLGVLQPCRALPGARRHGIREAADVGSARRQSCVAGSTTQLRVESPVRLRDVRGQRRRRTGSRRRSWRSAVERMPLRERRLVGTGPSPATSASMTVTLDLPAWSGRPLRYGTKPW